MRARAASSITMAAWVGALVALGSGCRLEPVANPIDPPPAVDLPDAAPESLDPEDVVVPPLDGGTKDVSPPPPDAREAATPDVAVAEVNPVEVRPPDLAIGPVDLAPGPPDVTPVDPLAMGLVARWRFDEGQGVRADDATGNGNGATLRNGVGWEKSSVPGAAAGDFAIRLDGVDDYLTAIPATIPAIDAPKSIAYWLAAEAIAPGEEGQRTCVALYSANPRTGIQVGFDGGHPAAWFRGQDRGFLVAPAMSTAGFHHVAYTFDGTSHRLYVDGAMVAMAPAVPPPGRVNEVFVGTYEVPYEMCAGLFDDLRLYDRALSPDEVRRLSGR